MNKMKNCRNCGAPLNEHGNCEYCGTKSPLECVSELTITANMIRFSTVCAEDLKKMADRRRIMNGYTS